MTSALTPGDVVYVSGPMSAFPETKNEPAFREAEARLNAAGYQTIIPHDYELPNDDRTWAEFMRKDMILLTMGHKRYGVASRNGKARGVPTAIALLPGWEESRGAVAEVLFAKVLDLKIVDAVTLKPLNLQALIRVATRGSYLNWQSAVQVYP